MQTKQSVGDVRTPLPPGQGYMASEASRAKTTSHRISSRAIETSGFAKVYGAIPVTVQLDVSVEPEGGYGG